MNTHIALNNLTFSRFKQVEQSGVMERKIFDSVSLEIPTSKIVGIVGSSGCGKTTLLKLISGQYRPQSGEVLYKEKNIHQVTQNELYSIRKEMGMLFQSGALLNDLSVFENVAFPLREHTKLNESTIASLVLIKLQAVGLRGAAEMFPSELSGGMTRRVALARTIALDPELILYDEPFAGQDPISMGILIKLIYQLNKLLGITSVVVSHDIQELLSIADIVYVLSDSRIIAHGTPNEISSSTDPWLVQFLKGQADGRVKFDYHSDDYFTQYKRIRNPN